MHTIHQPSAVADPGAVSEFPFLAIVRRGLLLRGEEIEFSRLYLIHAPDQAEANFKLNKHLLANFSEFQHAPDALFRMRLDDLSDLNDLDQDEMDRYMAAWQQWHSQSEAERSPAPPDAAGFLSAGLSDELLAIAVQLYAHVDFDQFPVVDCVLYYGANDDDNWASLVHLEQIAPAYLDFLVQRDMVEQLPAHE